MSVQPVDRFNNASGCKDNVIEAAEVLPQQTIEPICCAQNLDNYLLPLLSILPSVAALCGASQAMVSLPRHLPLDSLTIALRSTATS